MDLLELKLKRSDLIQEDLCGQIGNPPKHLWRHARSYNFLRRVMRSLLVPEGFQCRQIKGKGEVFSQRAQSGRSGISGQQVRACTSNQAFERYFSYTRKGAQKKKTIALWVGMDIKGLALISVSYI